MASYFGGDELSPSADTPTDFRSSSFKNLLGSYRRDNGDADSTAVQIPNTSPSTTTGTSSMVPYGSPVADGAPTKSKLLTSNTFARITKEKDEKSRMTPTPKKLVLKDGIKLPLLGKVR